MAERAVRRCFGMGGRGEALVVVSVMVSDRGRVTVAIVRVVPRAQGSRQDQQDRQGGERLRTKSHLTDTVSERRCRYKPQHSCYTGPVTMNRKRMPKRAKHGAGGGRL